MAASAGCGTDCLPPPRLGPGPALRGAVRLACLLLVLLPAIALMAVMAWLPSCRRRAVGAVGRILLRLLGVRLHVKPSGGPSGDVDPIGSGGALVVANHVSWLDVLALQTA